ncbi:MAG: STAS domain-containing protein [Chloroflexi bacterium]|nr:STAS domain-containing protein [Chloroflexota bacterium]
MKITEREQDGITILSLEGRIDGDGSAEVKATLQDCVMAGKFKVILDMAQVLYINSLALRALAEIADMNRQNNGDLKLVSPQPRVKRVFQLVGFDRLLAIHDTLQAALDDF